MPVITPFELQLGLGAREWDTTYSTSATSACALVGDDTSNAFDPAAGSGDDSGSEFSRMLQRVRTKWARSRSSSEGEEACHTPTRSGAAGGTEGVVSLKAEDQLTVFSSAAATYFHERGYQGLEASIPEGHSIDILPGTYGIATEYAHSSKST